MNSPQIQHSLGVLPAAGLAERLNGLPKFLLPLDARGRTLLDFHVELMLEVLTHVLIPVRPENARYLTKYATVERVSILAMETRSLADTIYRCARNLSPDDDLVLGMPDTYFSEANPYAFMTQEHLSHGSFVMGAWSWEEVHRGNLGQIQISASNQVTAVIDKDPLCNFKHVWGLLRFPATAALNSLREKETIGDLFSERAANGGLI